MARTALLGLVLLLGPGLAQAADPQIAAFTDSPDPVPAGGVVAYTARIDNNAVDAALNTRVRVRVPAGATFVSSTPAAPSCVPVSADTVECALGTLGPSGSDVRTLVTRWRATGPGPSSITATATVLADNDTNPDTSNNSQDNTTSVVSGADLSISKTDSPDPVVGGGLVTYTITVANAGPNAGGDLVVTDTLPPSVVFDSTAGAGWSCTHSAGTVRCTRAGPHPVGAPIPPLTVRGTVVASGGTVTNTARVDPAAGGVADPDTTNNTATADTTVLPGADVRIAEKVTLTPQPVVAGSPVSFVVRPRNAGPAEATGVEVVDPLPAGFVFVSAGGSGWSCSASAGTVRCTRATLPVGATDDITIVANAPPSAAVAPAGQSFTNTATVSATSNDPNTGNNSASATVQVRRDGADLTLGKVKLPSPVVAQGSNMTSTLIVGNNGPRVATGPLRVVELLDGESFVSASGSGWACTLTRPTAPQLLVCEHPNAGGLAVGASLPTLTLTTRADRAGEVINTACTGSSVPATAAAGDARPPLEGDPNTTNDCGVASRTSTTVQPDLAIGKTTLTPAGGDKLVSASEASVTYRLVVSNVSALEQPATGIVVRDTVPAFIAGRSSFGSFSVTASAGSTATLGCSSAGATVTCTQTGGQLRRLETLTIDIPVNRPLDDGSFTNTATVENLAEGDPNAANNQAQDTVTIEPVADVEMSGKTVTPGTLRAGEIATYVLSFRNNGPSGAAGVVVADRFVFPPGDAGGTVVEIRSSRPGSSCSIAAGAVLNPAADSFSCTIGSLANGETQSITLRLRVNFQPGNAARAWTNTASVTTTTRESPGGGDNGNNSRSAALTVQPALLDLLVNKTDLVDPVPYVNPVDGPTFVEYRLDVTNNGPSFGTEVRVEESMLPPAGRRVRFACDTASPGGACNAPALCTGIGSTSAPGTALPGFTCRVPAGSAATGAGVGELAVGATKSLFLRFEVLDPPSPTGDVYRNTARVLANEPDSLSSNDTEIEPTTLRQRVDLRVSKAASVATPTLFQPFNWVVTVVNNGPGNALQANVTDTLPAGTELTGTPSWSRSAAPGSGSCTTAGRAVTCNTGTLNAGGTLTITIPVRMTSLPAGPSVSNSATIDTNPDVTGAVNLPGGFETGTGTITVQRASLAGLVFEDRDRSGTNAGTPQAAASEPRIAGVTLRLTGTDAYGNAVDRSVTTGAGGAYSFDNLAPSSPAGYTVTQTQPAGFVNGPASPPASGGGAPTLGGSYDAGGAAGDSRYTGVVVGATSAGAAYNFPELRRPSLSGFVYIDADVNGVRSITPADPPVAGATVRLLDADTGALIASTTTAADGGYSFGGLDPLRRYTLEQPLPGTPAGLVNGPVNPGLVGGAACASGCTAQPDTPAAGTDRIAGIDLATGVDGTAFNFGELRQASISGTVYLDRDGDGVLDVVPVDGRLAGVTLRLVQGADCASGTTLATTTSGSDGGWRFDGVIAGASYLVCQTQPAGYADGGVNPGTGGAGAGSNAIRIASLPVGGSAGNDFGERAGAIAGSVFLDGNNNGLRDGADAGIGGVVVTLSGTDAAGNPVNRSTTTDASGAWRFDDLLAAGPAGYAVVQQAAQPVVGGVATLNGRTTPGSTGGTATAVAATPSAITGIALAAGGSSVEHRFAEILPARLDGTVFIDANDDGLQAGAGEAGLTDVTITLSGIDDTGATVTRSTTTDASGRYAFEGLRPGSYSVTEPVQPAGTIDGRTVPGSAGGSATPVGTTPSAISGIVLAPGAASSGNNFAEAPSNLRIGGRVWLDGDADGTLGGGEAGIAGVTIELSGTDLAGRPVSRSTVTAADGSFLFDGLAPGRYRLVEPVQPAGTVNGVTRPGRVDGTVVGSATPIGTTPSAIGDIVLGVGQSSVDNLFGEVPGAAIEGLVYADNDGNGVADAGEAGFPGVTIVLTGTDNLGNPVSLTTVTGPDGRWVFDGLRPGTYTVTQPVQPAGSVDGITSAGSAGGTATAPGSAPATPSAIAGIVLGPGVRSSDNRFGELAESPDLRVSKRLVEPRLTVGFTGRYRISVRNVGERATVGTFTVRDRLPAGLVLADAPSGTGFACSGAAGGSTVVCTSSTVVAAGATLADEITVPVRVTATAAGTLDNAVLVDGGGEIEARGPSAAERAAFAGDVGALPLCAAVPEANACRTPTPVQRAAALSGSVWHDVGSSTRLRDGGDRPLGRWQVEVVDAAGTVVGRASTGNDGRYRIDGLEPGVPLTVRFRDPDSGVLFAAPVNGETAPGSSGATCNPAAPVGTASSCAGGVAQPNLAVVLASGQELREQSLPIDPSGVVYDSGSRVPVPGSIVTLAPVGACRGWNPASGLVGADGGGYRVDGERVSMTVGADGFYQFLFSAAAPARCTWGLTVTPPAGWRFVSTAIPPQPGVLTPPGAAGSVFNVQPQAGPPSAAVGPGTTYHLQLISGSAGVNVLHNHLPLDPDLPASLALSKTGDRQQAELGDSVRYTVTVAANPGAPRARQTTVVDRLPAGFTFIPGTATVNDRRIADPAGGVGPTLAFQLGEMPASGPLVLRYRLRIGVGAAQGDGINRAQAHSCGVPAGCVDEAFVPLRGSVASNNAQYRVRVSGGVFTTEACVLGKIFVDCNGNHVQDAEELGIPGVRLVTQDGTTFVSDSEGKYGICGLRPRSHVLKVDPFTLPRGARLTTSSNRNLGDAGSLWLDLKNGELHRADFIEGSCSNTVLEQVKARRAQGEVRAPETERRGGPALRFDSKAHGLDTQRSPAQGTDGANQRAPKPRTPAAVAPERGQHERNRPTPELPMNRPPPSGRDSGQAPDAPSGGASAAGGAR